MTVLEAIILGIVQGFAEFLPISSSGHLKIVQTLFGFKEPMMAFDVLLHVGTLIPVLIVFWNEIFALIKKPFQKMTMLLIIGTLPAVIVTLVLGDAIDIFFSGGYFLAVGFIVTGILLLISDNLPDGKKKDKDITYFDALIVGMVQGVAIMPGISRSGSTITGALARRFNKSTAASFSFLLSILAILGGVVLQLKDFITGKLDMTQLPLIPSIVGFMAAMLSGYLAIRFMLTLIKNKKLKYFSYYVFFLAAFIILDKLVFGLVF